MYIDAEKIIVYLTPFVLKLNLGILIYDFGYNFSVEDKLFSCYLKDKPKINLLYRQIHYDLIYEQEYFEKYTKFLCNYVHMGEKLNVIKPDILDSIRNSKKLNRKHTNDNKISKSLIVEFDRKENVVESIVEEHSKDSNSNNSNDKENLSNKFKENADKIIGSDKDRKVPEKEYNISNQVKGTSDSFQKNKDIFKTISVFDNQSNNHNNSQNNNYNNNSNNNSSNNSIYNNINDINQYSKDNTDTCFNCYVKISLKDPNLNLCDNCVKNEVVMTLHQLLIKYNKEKFMNYTSSTKFDFYSRSIYFIIILFSSFF